MQSTLVNLNKFITLPNADRSVYATTYKEVLELVILEMKNVDRLFNALDKGYILAGSYLDNLKISKPDEFDVNITKSQQREGYVTINIKKGLDILSRLTDQIKTYSGYLLQDKVHSWLEGVVVKALRSINKSNSLNQIRHTKNGPAHTLNVNGQFSIDLVAGFVFKSDHHWISDRESPSYNSSWLAIPKPYKANTSINNENWIPAYAMLEKDKIRNKNTFKNAIRLFKKLRDNLNLCNLKSYFIKTVFLWELDRRPANYWEQSLKQTFLNSFDALIDCIDKREIKFYWDANFNMLSASLSEHQINDLGIRLKRARNVILENEHTPENFVNLFLTADEHEQYQQGGPLINRVQRLWYSSSISLMNNNQSVDTTDSCLKPKARNMCIII